MEIQRDKLQKLVGHCYRGDKKVFIITGVPEPEYMITGGFFFNPYRLSALFIVTEGSMTHKGKNSDFEGIIFKDTFSTKAIDYDDPLKGITEEYEEITVEQFQAIARKVVDYVIMEGINQEKD